METKTCHSCLSKVDIAATNCPYCKEPLSTGTGAAQPPAAGRPSYGPSGMVIVLRIVAWVFPISGAIAAFTVFPNDSISSSTTLDSYYAARATAPAMRMLAIQLGVSGVIAGIFTGALASILSALEQIRDRVSS